jgi:phosphohistidine swiveling domain-containing protein
MSLPSFFNNLTQLATRPMTVQRSEWAANSWWWFGSMRTACIPYDGGERVLYVDADDLKKSIQIEAEKIMIRNGWNEHLKLYEKSKNDFVVIEREIDELGDNKNEALIIFKKWVELLNRWGIFGFAPFAVEGLIDPKFRDIIKEKLPESFDKIIAVISSPSKLNSYQEMRLEILDAAIAQNFDAAKELARKYYWYSEYSFIEPFLDETYFVAEIKKVDPVQAKAEKEKTLHEVEDNKKNYVLVLEQITDEHTKLLAEILHVYTFLRTERIDIYKKGQAKIRKVYDLVAEILSEKTGQNWSRNHVANLTNNEIVDFLEKNAIPNKNDIDLRNIGEYIYYFDNGMPEITVDEELIAEAHKMMHREVKQEIKGSIAFKGKVSGKVSLIKGKADLAKVKDGDILVARITMPDYTPAMKIAAAFVTEEGGITSHAAIIARELKKPCIVGTGNCTKVLRDGDVIEVDAEKGTVKIIK